MAETAAERLKLTKGAGRIYVRTSGSILPTRADINSLKSGSLTGWEYMGQTSEDVVLTIEGDYEDVSTAQALRQLAKGRNGERVTIASTARRQDVATIARAISGTTASGTSDTVSPGGVEILPITAVAVIGPSPVGLNGDALFVAECCSFVGSVELTWGKATSATPFEIEVLEGDTLTQGWILYHPPAAGVTIDPPTELAGTPGDQQATLTWTASVGAETYRVYQDGIYIGSTTSVGYLVTGLTNGTPYDFTVSAVTAGGTESAQTAAETVTPSGGE